MNRFNSVLATLVLASDLVLNLVKLGNEIGMTEVILIMLIV